MYSPTSQRKKSSELAAQKALISFMKLTSVCPVLPAGVGVASSEDMDPARMSSIDYCLAFNRYTFAFGGSMDPTQSLNTGLQLRKDFDSGKGGNGSGVLRSKDEIVMPKKSSPPQPDYLPVRKSSLQRQSAIMLISSVESGDTLTRERRKSPCSRLKCGIRRLAVYFKRKNQSVRSERSDSLTKPRLSLSSSESYGSRKNVRFQDRVPDAFEPAFLSAPIGASNDRKSVLNSQFGQIQYNSSNRSADLVYRSSSAVTGLVQANFDSEQRPVRAGSEPMADLHSFPSFSEARTGIYQRLKGNGKGVGPESTLTMAVESSQDISRKKGTVHEDTVFPEGRTMYMDSHSNTPESSHCRYMNVDEFEEHNIDSI